MLDNVRYGKWLRKLLLKLNGPTPERGSYIYPAESLCALIGYSIGLGNLWRFPYFCHRHGGGTFLIPYVVCLVILGVPLCLLDQALGQYVSLGPTHLYTFMCPLLSGVGWGMALILLMITIYYNILLGWVIIYLVQSFYSTPHWSHCYDRTNGSRLVDCITNNITQADEAAKTFFEQEVLGGKWEDPTQHKLNWWLVGSAGCAWFLVAAVLAVGIKNRGKILYFTVIYPYIILVFLIMINKTLHNTSEEGKGWLHLEITPNLTHLADFTVWTDAAGQMFYSLGVGLGGITTISSYNTFNHNFIRDGFLLCLLDMVTSLLCGYYFISLTETQAASNLFRVSSSFLSVLDTQPWSSLFFLMVFVLGFNSQLMMVESVTTILFDQFKQLRRWHLGVVGVICGVLFLLGLPMCIAGKVGLQVFDLMDHYILRYSIFILTLFQLIIAGYIYGFDNMMRWVRKEMQQWIPAPLYYYLHITWRYVTPLFILVLLVFTLCAENWSRELEEGSTSFAVGHVIAIFPSLLLPMFALYFCLTRGDKSVKDLLTADPSNFCPEFRRIIRDPVRRPVYGLDTKEESSV